jgi:hypothetical protein
MANLTREMVDNELVPLLKSINEQIRVEDVTGGDIFYTDGTVQGSLCKIMCGTYTIYLWANGDFYCASGIRNNNVMNTLKEWLSPKFTSANLTSESQA